MTTTRSQSAQMTTIKNTSMTTRIIKSLKRQIEQLFNKEKGCVSDGSRGSFVIGFAHLTDSEFIVSFGWNFRDTIKCIGADQLKAVVETLIENNYVFNHSEDMIVYFTGSGYSK